MSGCEVQASEWFNNGLLVLAGITPIRDSSLTARTGTYSWQCASSAANAASNLSTATFTRVLSRVYYLRGYFYFSQIPTAATTTVMQAGPTGFGAKVTSGGKLRFYNLGAGTQIGSDSAATLTTGVWYRIEISFTVDATLTNTYTAGELMLDGTSVASTSGASLTGVTGTCGWGLLDAPGANITVAVDDIALNDNTGAANNSWPGDGKIVWMEPISDNARGAWTGGAGGTTNLWNGVNAGTAQLTGVADASATDVSQIKNKTTTNPSSCDLNLATYTAAGVGSADIVNAILILDVDGEDTATGTKTGACSMVSNPVIAEPTAFNFGDDAGLQGSYPGLWAWHAGVMTDAPSVTKGTAPVIRIRCISGATATRAASCCLLGAYVDYTPLTPLAPPFMFQGINSNMLR